MFVIAKKDWFKPRIAGWGLRPVTKEGWIYIFICTLIFIGLLNIPIDYNVRFALVFAFLILFLYDFILVMILVYKRLSEKEKKRQWLIEATVSYTAVGAIILVFLYEAVVHSRENIGLLIVLLIMVITKTIASFKVKK